MISNSGHKSKPALLFKDFANDCGQERKQVNLHVKYHVKAAARMTQSQGPASAEMRPLATEPRLELAKGKHCNAWDFGLEDTVSATNNSQ